MNKLYLLTFCCLVSIMGVKPAWSAGETPIELQIIEHEAVDGDDGARLLYGLAYLDGPDTTLIPDVQNRRTRVLHRTLREVDLLR